MIEAMLAQKARMIPEKGFRLVGLDDFEPPGSQLYPISLHATRKEAEAAMKKYAADRQFNSDPLFIYASDDH